MRLVMVIVVVGVVLRVLVECEIKLVVIYSLALRLNEKTVHMLVRKGPAPS